MENKIVTAIFKDSTHTKVSDVWQYDYGQILRIQGLNLPTAVEVDFAVAGSSESIARIGTTKDGVTDVVIPDSLIETGKNLVAYIYLRDSASGNTEYQIDMLVTKRAKPEAYDRPEDKELFGQAIEAVNTAADRAEKAGKTAQEAATKTGQDAEQTAQDRVEVAKMVETVTDISEQVKKVEDLSSKAQAAATKTEADAQRTAEDRAEVGKMLETVKDVSEQVKTVDESVRKAKESEQAAEGHRTAVEEMKNSVEQTASGITQVVQTGVQEINSAKQSAVQEVTQTGTAQKTAVEGAGTQAVESVDNAKTTATEAVEIAKTEAVQAVQAEGTKQTGSVTAEGTKQVKAVQDKGAEVLQSIPEDFQTQMETKLNKQQGIENKGKVLVIGEDGNVVPEEVASGGGDGIAIINTMSGESPLVIPDSAERVNKRLELGGKTEQVQTSGKNLIDYKKIVVGLLNFVDGTFSGIYHTYFTTDFIEIESGDYVISHNSNVGIQSYALYDINNKTYVSGKAGNNKVNVLNKCLIRISFNTKPETDVSSNPIDYAKKCNIQLEKGTTATPYEQYTGGKPSPSQEYPQEIKNVGKWNEETQKYEVDVKITGKNLFDIEKAKEKSNWTTSANGAGFVEIAVYVGTGSTVTVSNNTKINGPLSYYYGVALKSSEDFKYFICYPGYPNYKDTFTFTATEDYIYVRCNKTSLNDVIGVCGGLQIEIGASRTDFESYKEQTLTITSDRPLTKWDRLVEQGGEIGWLYQSASDTDVKPSRLDLFPYGFGFFKDFGNGVYVYKVVNIKKAIGFQTSLCEQFKNKDGSYSTGDLFCYSDQPSIQTQYFVTDIPTLEEFKTWMETNPLTMVYQTVESTEFVPLPQSEQAAIRALKTYYPTTVITADGGELDPDIKATYTADTKNYIDGKVSAKVASILRQYQADTANLLSLMPMETQATMIENDTNNILNNLESEETHE